MELSELTAYASEKYQIREERKWADFPGFSVLCHPQTGKWVALLMRQWDTDLQRRLLCAKTVGGQRLCSQRVPQLPVQSRVVDGACFRNAHL